MARAFNGSSQSLQSAAVLSAISGKSRLAIGFWLNTVFASDDDIVLEYSADSNANAGSFKAIANESGSGEFWVDMLGNSGKANARTNQFGTSSTWYQWVIQLNFGNAGTTEVESIWRAGTQLALGQDLANNNTGTFGSYVLNVMSRNNTALFADGSMADLCIWAPTTALTSTEIGNLAAGRRASTVRNSEILYYWPLQGTTSPEPASIGTTALTVIGATAATDPPALDAIGGGTDGNVAAVKAVASAAGRPPVLSAAASVAVVAAAAVGVAVPPIVSTGSNGSVTAVPAVAVAAARAPVISATQSATVNAAKAIATAAAQPPIVSGELVLSGGGPAIATAVGRAPAVSAASSITAAKATSSAVALAPTVSATSAGSATVNAVPAVARGAGVAPSLITSASITSVKAVASAAAIAPVVSILNSVTVTATPATATARSLAPILRGDCAVVAARAIASAAARTPVVTGIDGTAPPLPTSGVTLTLTAATRTLELDAGPTRRLE